MDEAQGELNRALQPETSSDASQVQNDSVLLTSVYYNMWLISCL